MTSQTELTKNHYWLSMRTCLRVFDVYQENTICTDDKITPVVHACRKVPFALRKKLKEELRRLEKVGHHHKKWMNPQIG